MSKVSDSPLPVTVDTAGRKDEKTLTTIILPCFSHFRIFAEHAVTQASEGCSATNEVQEAILIEKRDLRRYNVRDVSLAQCTCVDYLFRVKPFVSSPSFVTLLKMTVRHFPTMDAMDQ